MFISPSPFPSSIFASENPRSTYTNTLPQHVIQHTQTRSADASNATTKVRTLPSPARTSLIDASQLFTRHAALCICAVFFGRQHALL
jgi:hypothetical protein